MTKKSRNTIYLLLGMLILLTACSPLVTQSTSQASPATQDTGALYTAAAQTVQHTTAAATLVSPEATQAEVHPPVPTSEPTKSDSTPAEGIVTDASINIFLEEGSGTLCTADSTYFVHASITADGPTIASYEIGSAAGQIAAGNFQDMDGNLFPAVSSSVVFDQADTKNIHLRFVGPYPYPDDISVFLRVNGEEFYNAKLSCQG
jgi:hypothetical protein